MDPCATLDQCATTVLSDVLSNGEQTLTMLFYLFSTIPQTLAAAFGILGVFALYRLQQLEDKMNRACDDAKKHHAIKTSGGVAGVEFDAVRIQGEWEKVASRIYEWDIRNGFYEQFSDLIRKSYKAHIKLKKALKESLLPTTVTIMGSLIMLTSKRPHNRGSNITAADRCMYRALFNGRHGCLGHLMAVAEVG